MRSLFTFFLIAFVAVLFVACSGDGNTNETPTPASSPTVAASPTSEASPTTAASATAEASTTPQPPAGASDIGPDAVSDSYQDIIGKMYSSCTDMTAQACLDGVVADSGASDAVKNFWQQHQAFLVDFEEHGMVDYGSVSSPTLNMARPEPVFLNGDFGLQYLSELVPQDWQSQPSYASLGDVIAWAEYGTLADAQTSGNEQTFTVQIPIRECRACADLGDLGLKISFQNGSLANTEVLPFTPSETPTPEPTATP